MDSYISFMTSYRWPSITHPDANQTLIRLTRVMMVAHPTISQPAPKLLQGDCLEAPAPLLKLGTVVALGRRQTLQVAQAATPARPIAILLTRAAQDCRAALRFRSCEGRAKLEADARAARCTAYLGGWRSGCAAGCGSSSWRTLKSRRCVWVNVCQCVWG
jgi:hypothetical protein